MAGWLKRWSGWRRARTLARRAIPDEIWLDTLLQKHCYAYRSLAATLRALKHQEEAQNYQQKSCGLDSHDEDAIQAWVDLETRHAGQSQRASRP